MLLILTSEKDLTADFLIVTLIKRGLLYFRLNVEELANADYEFTVSDKQKVTVRDGRSLDLKSVTAVWYRRAIYPIASQDLPPNERFFISGELRHLVFGMVWNPDIRWVNPVDKVYVAEHKLYQLRLAQQLGILVPKTLATSSPKDAANFVQQAPNGAICKPIFHGLYNDGSDDYSIYTRPVQTSDFQDEASLGCPVLLQECVPRFQDLRCHIHWKEVFCGGDCYKGRNDRLANTRGRSEVLDNIHL